MKSKIFWLFVTLLGPPIYMLFPVVFHYPHKSMEPEWTVISALGYVAGWIMGLIATVNLIVDKEQTVQSRAAKGKGEKTDEN